MPRTGAAFSRNFSSGTPHSSGFSPALPRKVRCAHAARPSVCSATSSRRRSCSLRLCVSQVLRLGSASCVDRVSAESMLVATVFRALALSTPVQQLRGGFPICLGCLVDAFDLYSALQTENPKQLIDVRLPGEFRLDGHIEGSINIPAYEWQHGFYTPREDFANEVRAAGFDEDVPLVLVCADGRLSAGAKGALASSGGYAHVGVLEGGLSGWQDAELPVVVDEDGEGGLTGAWI